MTTVINLNFLNFFQLKQNNYTINDVRSYNQYFDNRRQEYSQEQGEIIDITPYPPVLTNNNEGVKSRLNGTLKTVPNLVSLSGLDKTYDRRGRSIQYCNAKGTHVNSYA